VNGCFWLDCPAHPNIPKNTCLIKLKEPGLQTGSFNFCLGGEEKSPYEVNFITCAKIMLDASPTSLKRLHNGFYEIFSMEISP
jgi:hypothetical protein